jgi:hypothetical protein
MAKSNWNKKFHYKLSRYFILEYFQFFNFFENLFWNLILEKKFAEKHFFFRFSFSTNLVQDLKQRQFVTKKIKKMFFCFFYNCFINIFFGELNDGSTRARCIYCLIVYIWFDALILKRFIIIEFWTEIG